MAVREVKGERLRLHIKDRIHRQHTSAYVSIRQHTSAYVSIRQHTSAYVSIRQFGARLRLHIKGRISTAHVCCLMLLVHGALSYLCMGP